jgi:DNA polymerase II small subunit/DNA polymerase delta subunit B
MEKLEILKLFLQEGVQLTPQALELIFQNQETIDKIREYAKQNNLVIIDEKVFLEIKKQEELEIKILYPEEILNFSVEDVVKMLMGRFSFLSKLIQESHRFTDLTSINRLKKLKKGEEATVIGMIKDKTIYSVLLEDLTSYETIQMEARVVEKLFYDDVIAVKVKREDERLVGDKIFFPSVSFFRRPANLSKELIVSSTEIKLNSTTIPIEAKEVTRIYLKDFKLFLLDSRVVERYKGKEEKEIDTLISLIERRHLNPSFFISKKLYKKDLFLLDEVPDTLVLTNANEALFKVYKGINIFFLPEGKRAYVKKKIIE